MKDMKGAQCAIHGGSARRGSCSRIAARLVIGLAVVAVVAVGSASLPNLSGWGHPEPDSGERFPAAHESTISGRASVIDGDSLEIHGTRIRLFGIDAPESAQSCLREGIPVRCGQKSALALSDKIGTRPISCVSNGTDRYGRAVAVCRAGSTDLNKWMVSRGWAVAYRQYSSTYASEEEAAAKAKRGIWQTEFIMPWDWRRSRGSTSDIAQNAGPNSAPGSCVIKGNVSASGERIYHVPGGAFYSRTFVNPIKGERWFCSEAEARAAGWRRSRR